MFIRWQVWKQLFFGAWRGILEIVSNCPPDRQVLETQPEEGFRIDKIPPPPPPTICHKLCRAFATCSILKTPIAFIAFIAEGCDSGITMADPTTSSGTDKAAQRGRKRGRPRRDTGEDDAQNDDAPPRPKRGRPPKKPSAAVTEQQPDGGGTSEDDSATDDNESESGRLESVVSIDQ